MNVFVSHRYHRRHRRRRHSALYVFVNRLLLLILGLAWLGHSVSISFLLSLTTSDYLVTKVRRDDLPFLLEPVRSMDVLPVPTNDDPDGTPAKDAVPEDVKDAAISVALVSR